MVTERGPSYEGEDAFDARNKYTGLKISVSQRFLFEKDCLHLSNQGQKSTKIQQSGWSNIKFVGWAVF
jgi:hypothetical protein